MRLELASSSPSTRRTGKGRKKENIIRIRAVWNEDDGTHHGGCPLVPNILVETSPHRYHHYWLFDGELTPGEFRAIMRTMVAKYGCDKNATDTARVMRVPGFFHNKAERRSGPAHRL